MKNKTFDQRFGRIYFLAKNKLIKLFDECVGLHKFLQLSFADATRLEDISISFGIDKISIRVNKSFRTSKRMRQQSVLVEIRKMRHFSNIYDLMKNYFFGRSFGDRSIFKLVQYFLRCYQPRQCPFPTYSIKHISISELFIIIIHY